QFSLLLWFPFHGDTMKLLPLNETSMNLILPSKLLQTVQMTEAQMLTEIAVMLYQQQRLKFEQAAELTGMALDDFYQLLVSRNILTPPTDPDDEPKELILTSLCISLQQAKEGKVHPISELWDGIDD
ncbi:MAG: UPF0175 family protein, partial [Microcystis sp. M53600_WE12]|nr:UPF0175 family protein [Microcystis sp. M53600_WE12]